MPKQEDVKKPVEKTEAPAPENVLGASKPDAGSVLNTNPKPSGS